MTLYGKKETKANMTRERKRGAESARLIVAERGLDNARAFYRGKQTYITTWTHPLIVAYWQGYAEALRELTGPCKN